MSRDVGGAPKVDEATSRRAKGVGQAPTIPSFPHAERTLKSGLRVITVPRPLLHRCSLALFVRVGSRFETKDDNGISHFLEHMLYRGTPSMPSAHDQSLAFERLGGMLYAATATDHGVMSLSLPPESVAPAIALLGEVALSPRFSAIDVERRIVSEEILEDVDDDGRPIDADNLSREQMYDGHPLGFPITGTAAHLATFDEATLAAHHARHYVADNAVLAIAGAFDEDALFPALEAAFARMPRGARVATDAPAPMPKGGAPRVRYVDSDGSQTDLRLAFRGPGDHHPMEPATEVLLRVIDDGMSTRLYERICDAQGLCYDVSAAYETYEDDAVFDFAAETQHARTPEVARELLALCAELAEHGPTADELDKVRARTAWSTRAMLDDPDDLAGFYGLAALANVARTPSARAEQIFGVTRAEVRDAAASLFRPDRLGAVAVGVLSRGDQRKLEKVVRNFGK